ncbi:hypothetical protein AB9K33_21600 [Citrobacter freundii]
MNNKKILMDISWSNMGGIGRFTDEISKLLTGISCAKIYKKCASPFAPLGLAVNIFFQGKVDLILLPVLYTTTFLFKKIYSYNT